MADKLEKESGDAFDKLYMENAGTKDHKMVLSKLQSDAKNIKDPFRHGTDKPKALYL